MLFRLVEKLNHGIIDDYGQVNLIPDRHRTNKGQIKSGVAKVSDAQEIRTLVRRLARPHRQKKTQGLQDPSRRREVPIPATQRVRIKKSPSLGTVRALCEAWAETANTPRDRIAAKHLAALAGSMTAHELLPAHFEAIVGRWKERHKRNTVCNYRIGLHRLARFIAMTAGRPEIPTFVPKVPNYRPRQVVADPADIAVLMNAAPGWLRCAILLAGHAGLRASDVLRAAPIHYNREAATLSIIQKKGGHPVTVPVTEALAEILNNAPEGIETTPYLELLAGKPVSKQMLWQTWTRLKKQTRVGGEVTSHDLRRTLAVSLYEVSKDLRVVEQMLGHQTLRSTVAYLEHRDPAKLRPYLDAIHIPKGGRVQ